VSGIVTVYAIFATYDESAATALLVWLITHKFPSDVCTVIPTEVVRGDHQLCPIKYGRMDQAGNVVKAVA